MLELELRHLSALTDFVIGGAYLPDDDGGDDSDEEHPLKESFAGQDRWLVNVDHLGGFGKPWQTKIDYTKVSDEDYFRDLGNGTSRPVAKPTSSSRPRPATTLATGGLGYRPSNSRP